MKKQPLSISVKMCERLISQPLYCQACLVDDRSDYGFLLTSKEATNGVHSDMYVKSEPTDVEFNRNRTSSLVTAMEPNV